MDALCYFHGNQDICQMHGHTAMCNSVCSVQYKQILKECISGWILCSIWHLNIWKAGSRITHYSKCLQVIIQGEMLMKVWVNLSIWAITHHVTTLPFIGFVPSHPKLNSLAALCKKPTGLPPGGWDFQPLYVIFQSL